ncbi:M48 family metallopeptidase [Candidatus Woesearchaeota archaeon]|nr:M48 family metallopeptidase [Candidatus Woesearchaeota archaeon]
MRIEYMEVNGIKYPINIFIEDRKNISARIGRKIGTIRAPLFLNRDELSREILKMKVWIRQKLIETPIMLESKAAKTYTNGDILKIGSDKYLLDISFKDKQSSSARIAGKIIYLMISSSIPDDIKNHHISSLLSRCVARKRIEGLKSRINGLNQKYFNQKVDKIFFKNNKSNWGSCSNNGNINVSTRLLFAPEDVLEYVCVHELAHLIEHNHSQKFWALIEKAMPDYKEKEKWLKENGNKCVF